MEGESLRENRRWAGCTGDGDEDDDLHDGYSSVVDIVLRGPVAHPPPV